MTEVYKDNMNYLMRALLPYQPVAKTEDDDKKVTIPNNWQDYPALRPPALTGVQPPSGKVLVKTGGNALQAIDRRALEQDNVVAVTVPWNTRPGDIMLVRLPQDRLVRTKVPDGMQPGHVFLMRVPEPALQMLQGAPSVDFGIEAQLLSSQEVHLAPSYANELQLREEMTKGTGKLV